MQGLEDELKQLIVDTLALEDVVPAEIDASQPLFGAGLGLDSIDALELGIALQRKYGIKLDAPTTDLRPHFASVHCLALFVASHRKT